jgi:hypothetical protein
MTEHSHPGTTSNERNEKRLINPFRPSITAESQLSPENPPPRRNYRLSSTLERSHPRTRAKGFSVIGEPALRTFSTSEFARSAGLPYLRAEFFLAGFAARGLVVPAGAGGWRATSRGLSLSGALAGAADGRGETS